MSDFALEGPVWSTPVVTWSFAAAGNSAFTNAITGAYQQTIQSAINAWAQVTNLTIQQVAPGTPGTDITIGWGSFANSALSNQIGQTEYSYNLGSQQTFVPGMTIHIEDPSLMALSAAPGATYQGTSTTLYEVALHEFGHALGLGISSNPSAVMNIALGPNNAAISAADIAGVNAMYGARTSAAGTATSLQVSSAPAAPAPAAPGTVDLTPGTLGVYRFFDTQSGTQFLTGNVAEANNIISSNPGLVYQGLAMAGIAPGANDPNAVPVYRFFDTSNGTHFFTSSQSEESTILATRPDLVLEQSSFYEHSTQQAGDVAVYRFFEKTDGTHFFTQDAGEKASLIATRPDMAFEGVAFYAPKVG